MSLSGHCARIVRAARTNFYWAFAFLPREKRVAIFAVYAFARHTDDLVDEAVSPSLARSALTAWRVELENCYAGSAGHPVTAGLLPVVRRFAIPKGYFLDLIDGVEMDISRDRYGTFSDLEAYCYRVASVIGLICIEIFGYRNPATRDYAVSLGTALQLTNILRDLGEDIRRNRIYLPEEDLSRFGYTETDLRAGVVNRAFRLLMAFECERADACYRRAEALLPEEDRRAMFSAQIMGRIYHDILEEIVRRGYDVFHGRIGVPTSRKVGIALCAWFASRLPDRGTAP